MLSLGLMSGTSMDGIDAALIQTDGDKLIKTLAFSALNYTNEFRLLLKSAEFAIRQAQGNIEVANDYFNQQAIINFLISELGLTKADSLIIYEKLVFYIRQEVKKNMSLASIFEHSTNLHCEAVKILLEQHHYSPEEISVIGYHGQALYHQPHKKISIIIGDGQMLANKIGINVINDFRSNDIAHGGQGAPFAPIYHLALASRDNLIPAAIINCGGIANISFVNSHDPKDLIAFDTGPGNALIDKFVRQRTKTKENMDKDGKYGKYGKINPAILELLYENAIIKNNINYFNLMPPKSLDIGDIRLIDELDSLSLEDGCATLAAFTADSILHSLKYIEDSIPKHWILVGGGWKNPIIYQELNSRLIQRFGNDVIISRAEVLNWNSQAIEAELFAYLAVRSLQSKPLSYPNTTHVAKPITGGKIYYPKFI